MSTEARGRRSVPVAGAFALLLLAGPAMAAPDLRLEVDKSERVLHVVVDGQTVATHPVAVGQSRYPTPTGTWAVYQVIWNPAWNPPNRGWARGRSYTPPGHPKNPMGRVKLVYDPPYYVHGTNALGSLGTAASHGCVRVANDVIVDIAPLVMEAGGAPRSDAWVDAVLDARSTQRVVDLPDPVPITIRE